MLIRLKVYLRAGEAEKVIRTSPVILRSAVNLIVKLLHKAYFNIEEKTNAPTSLQ